MSLGIPRMPSANVWEKQNQHNECAAPVKAQPEIKDDLMQNKINMDMRGHISA